MLCSELRHLADYLKSLNGEPRVVMERIGRYYEQIAQYLHDAGIYVSAVNPKPIKDYSAGNTLFDSPVREDGTQKWVDFAMSFWHVDCVRGMSQSAFAQRYAKWCQQHEYQARVGSAEAIHESSKELAAMLPKDAMTKLLVRQAISALNAVSVTLERLKSRDAPAGLPAS